MDRLPAELIQGILMHADIDKDLLQFNLACHKFAVAVQDTTFALQHIRRRFQLSQEWMTICKQLNKTAVSRGLDPAEKRVWRQVWTRLASLSKQLREHPGQLPFAYKAALFVLASQANMLPLFQFSAHTRLRIVQSINSAHPIDWNTAVIFLASECNMLALNYVISNHLRNISDKAIVLAIEDAAVEGKMEALSLLLACPTSDPEPLSLDEALNQAVLGFKLDCIEAILKDPSKRVTCTGRDAALEQAVTFSDLPMSILLVQYGVSFDCLANALYIAPQLMHQILEQPGLDPSYLNYVLLLESMYTTDSSASRQLLNEERVTITMNDYGPVRKALEWRRTEHLLLFLEVAELKSDTEPFRIIREYLNQNETPAHFRECLLEAMEAIKRKPPGFCAEESIQVSGCYDSSIDCALLYDNKLRDIKVAKKRLPVSRVGMRKSFLRTQAQAGRLAPMDTLPTEVLHSILVYTDIDKDLHQLGLVCRKFGAAVQETTFALEHIRRQFQLPRDGMERLAKLNEMVFSPGLDDADILFHIHFPDDTTLRIVQSINSAHPVNWNTAVTFMATAESISALDYVINNHLHAIGDMAIVSAIEAAAPFGQIDALLLLLTCPPAAVTRRSIKGSGIFIRSAMR
ncbi:hypothetical protein HDU81_008155 [Chytriomyces hyalinus]|nr:hypothetical protein HDU81_008155 [Chytriomyces hyalinus]